MKKGWQTKKLGDVCATIQDGAHESPQRQFDSPGKGRFLYITSKNIRNNCLDLGNVSYVEEDFHNRIYPRCKPSAGDVLLTKDGANTGNVTLNTLDEPFSLLSSVCLIKTKPDALKPSFLSYYIQSPDGLKSITGQMTGAAIKRIILRDIKLAPIPVPSLPEQQRIVGILDEAFESIATAKANAEKNLKNARALFESHLQAVFTQRGEGWEEKQLSELCDIKHGFAFDGEFFSNEGEYVLLTPGNFYEAGGYRDRGQKQKYYTGEIPRDYVLNEGDLLVAMTEQAAGLLGSPILVPEPDKFLHNQRLGLVTKKPGIPWINEFFFHVFNTHAVRKEIHGSASGVKVRHTSPTKIGDVVVSFPTVISEQRAIVSTLKDLHAETQRLESICQHKLAALGELKKSLLHQAFSGKL